jgi:hypothetical protein
MPPVETAKNQKKKYIRLHVPCNKVTELVSAFGSEDNDCKRVIDKASWAWKAVFKKVLPQNQRKTLVVWFSRVNDTVAFATQNSIDLSKYTQNFDKRLLQRLSEGYVGEEDDDNENEDEPE